MDNTLKSSLTDKSKLDQLYDSLTNTKNEIEQVCIQHHIETLHSDKNSSDHQLMKENKEYAQFIQNLIELEHRLKILDSATSYIKSLYITMELW